MHRKKKVLEKADVKAGVVQADQLKDIEA